MCGYLQILHYYLMAKVSNPNFPVLANWYEPFKCKEQTELKKKPNAHKLKCGMPSWMGTKVYMSLVIWKGTARNKRTTHSKGTKGIMGLFHRKGTIGSKRTFYWKGTKGSLGLFHSKGTMGSLGSFHWKGSNVHLNRPIQFYNRLNKCDWIKQALINIFCSTIWV